ncbi:MAG: hypothetical protein JNN28_11230 [Saprospiraceae bacterium]|nr:hypothetical protein [Saprospiraceae bacterium]
MKRTFCLVALFTLIGMNLHAQRTATWKGGTPGRSSAWDCPTNWKEGRVPDEFTHVFIPDVSTSTFNYPCIKERTVEVASIQLASNALLHLERNATLLELDHLKPSKILPANELLASGSAADSSVSFQKKQR